MSKKSGLGRGLDSIFMENTVESSSGSVTTLRIGEIEPKKDQPRKAFESEALSELAESIAAHGVLQPIIVRRLDSGFYQIIAGERRWRASKMAGLTEVPVVIMEIDDAEAAQIALIENIQREDLNAVEEALAYRALIADFSLTQEEVAQRVGKSRSAITNSLRLLDLPDDVAALLRDGEISAGHAKALLGLKDEDSMIILAKKIVNDGLSVRAVEDAVRNMNKQAAKPEEPEEEDDGKIKIDYLADIEHRLMKSLGRKVKITSKGKNKKITLEFRDEEDFESLVKMLDPSAID